jgi:hypothetical protein
LTSIDSSGNIYQQTSVGRYCSIKPPTRLFFSYFFFFYVNADSETKKTYGTLKGGLDKIWNKRCFTLDMILVPDFGQTKYDDQVTNLGSFEQQ